MTGRVKYSGRLGMYSAKFFKSSAKSSELISRLESFTILPWAASINVEVWYPGR